MVGLITALFKQGGIHVLVGTTSLLGEGWDAPSVNSLILASFVGSYMLSNQMRGRAIRTQEGNPHKTANIWHLVCQEEDAEGTQRGHGDPGQAVQVVRRRILHEPPDRERPGTLGLGRPPYTTARMDHINAVMQRRACDRATAHQRMGAGPRLRSGRRHGGAGRRLRNWPCRGISSFATRSWPCSGRGGSGESPCSHS